MNRRFELRENWGFEILREKPRRREREELEPESERKRQCESFDEKEGNENKTLFFLI